MRIEQTSPLENLTEISVTAPPCRPYRLALFKHIFLAAVVMILSFFKSSLKAVFLVAFAATYAAAQNAPITIYEENFDGQTGLPKQIDTIPGFTSHPSWNNSGSCNGILLDTTVSGQNYNGPDGQCDSGPMDTLALIAAELGPTGNVIVSSYTDGADSGGSLQLQSPTFSLTNQRFYTASLDVGAINCRRDRSTKNTFDPQHSFRIAVAGNTSQFISLGAPLSVCSLGPAPGTNGVPPAANNNGYVRTGTIASIAAVKWTLGSSAVVQVLNAELRRQGNDSAVDNLILQDVTPTLTKAFGPNPVVAGQPTTLTFTITNTSDLLAKEDMDFTDTLTAGLSVVSGASPTSTCGNGTVSASGSVISVTGADLALNEVSCTIAVDVVASAVGTFENDSDNMSGLNYIIDGTDAELVVTAPQAVDEATSVNPGDTATFDVSANDTDFAGGTNTFTRQGGTATGATIDATGTVTWDSTGFLAGDYTVIYEICNQDFSPALCDTAVLTITVLPEPSIELIKSATVPTTNLGLNTSVTDAGDQITFSFLVRNTGNIALSSISVNDPDVGAVNCGASSLAPTETTTCTAPAYTISQVDMDAGGVENTANVTASSPGNTGDVTDVSDTGTDTAGGTVADPAGTESPDIDTVNGDNTDAIDGNDPTAVAIAPVATIELVKSASAPTTNLGLNGGIVDADDEITFSFTLRNTGTVTLSSISVSDPDVGTVTCAATSLAPGATTTCTAPAYVISQTDINDGGVENTANVTASSPGNSGDVTDVSDAGTNADGTAVGDPAGTETPDIDGVNGDNNDGDAGNDPTPVTLTPVASVSLIKLGSAPTVAGGSDPLLTDPGDTISYTFQVTNTGNVPLSNVTVTDPKVAVSGGPIISLAPGAVDNTTFTAIYTVQAIDITNRGVENTAEVKGTAPGGVTDAVQDISDSGYGSELTNDDDLGEAGDPNGTADDDADPTNDPTVVAIPYSELRLTKTGSTPTVSAGANPTITDAGDTISYTFRVENTGNTVLTNVTVTDQKATMSGGPITSLPVGGIDTGTFTATYTITNTDLVNGGVENTATATGTPPTGPNVTDISDTGAGSETTSDPDLGEAGDANSTTDDDTNPTNDPTVTLIPGVPSVQLTKTAGTPTVALGADPTITDEGDTISYTFRVENTGNTVLTDVTVTDAKANVSGGPLSLLGINGVDTATFTATYTIDNTDVINGGVENTAQVFATAPGGTPGAVIDTSDTGAGSETTNDPDLGETGDANGTADDDGNPTNDPTVTLFDTPRLELIKTASNVVDFNADAVTGNAGDTVDFTFAVTNTGNVTLTNVTVTDPALGGAVGTIPSLAPQVTQSVSTTYTFQVADVTRGYFENTATTTGTPPSGPAVSDISDTGSAPDLTPIGTPGSVESPNGTGGTDTDPTNDPTVTTVPLVPSGASVSGTVYLDANGNGSFDPGTDPTQAGFTVELKDASGNVIGTTTSGPDGTYSMAGFPVGTGYTIEFSDPATGKVIGTLPGLNFGPTTALTNQNQPIDPSGVLYNSATGAPIPGVGLQMTDAGGTPLPSACLLAGQQPQVSGADGGYRFDVVPGADPACPASETEYMIQITTYPSGYISGPSSTYPPETGAIDATTCPADAVPGGACQLSSSPFAPAAGTTAPYFMSFLLAPGDPNVVNNHIPLDPIATGPVTGVSIAKTALITDVVIGDSVPYQITVTNENASAVVPVTVIDELPQGMVFTPGTAFVNGTAVTPTVAGREVSFAGLTLPANGTIQVDLVARVTGAAPPGAMVNVARIVDGTSGIDLATPAEAIIRRRVEHVFDCSDIIGKVFDDTNHNGYQDEGELGLAGVRLSTIDGTLITTDSHGRYHVPCAELPQNIGSNFYLKLDARTLPSGYRVTTENPRVVRVTRGKFAKLNFGASISNVVDIDLTDAAFKANSTEPTTRLEDGVVHVIEKMRDTPSIMRISYYVLDEEYRVVKRRLDVLEELVRDRWKERGRYKLNIERTVKVMQ